MSTRAEKDRTADIFTGIDKDAPADGRDIGLKFAKQKDGAVLSDTTKICYDHYDQKDRFKRCTFSL